VDGVTSDTGALIAADRNDRRMWALHAGFLALEVSPTVPTTVLAEASRRFPPGESGPLKCVRLHVAVRPLLNAWSEPMPVG
jgi:hypothetical protein